MLIFLMSASGDAQVSKSEAQGDAQLMLIFGPNLKLSDAYKKKISDAYRKKNMYSAQCLYKIYNHGIFIFL